MSWGVKLETSHEVRNGVCLETESRIGLGGWEIGVLMPYDGMGDGEARPKHHPCGWNESVQRKNTPSIPTAL